MLGADYIRLVLSRWRLVMGIIFGCTLAAWLFSALILAQNPKFEASARLNIVPTSEELGYATRFVRGSTFDGGSTLLGTYAEFAHTRPVVEPIVDRFIAAQAAAAGQSEDAWIAANSVPSFFSPGRLISILNYGEAPAVPLREDIVDAVIKHTIIETVEGTYLLRITVEWDDPKVAAWFANGLADAIIARAERMSKSSGTEIANSLQTRLAGKQGELAAVLRRSRALKSSVGVVDVDRQKQSLLEAQIAEQSQLTSDRATLQANKSQVAGLKRQNNGKLSPAQAAIDESLAIEGPKAAGLAQGITIRENRVAQIKGQIDALGRQEDTIRGLDDQANQLRAEVAALTERVNFSQTENLANAPRIQLIERAVPPLVRSSPKTLFNTVLGFIAGCALAGCALLLLGEAPARVRNDEEVTDGLDGEEPAFIFADRPVEPEPVAPETVAPEPMVGVDRVIEDEAPVPEVEVPSAEEAAWHDPTLENPEPTTGGVVAPARDAEPVYELADRLDPDIEILSETEHLSEVAAIETDAEKTPEPVEDIVPLPERERADWTLPTPFASSDVETRVPDVAPGFSTSLEANGGRSSPPETVPNAPASVALEDRVFGYLLPPPRHGRRYNPSETRGIGTQVADWLGNALSNDTPMTIAATGAATDAQRLYQLLHDYRAEIDAPVLTVDWSNGVGAFPRGDGKPLIYAGGDFGPAKCLAHQGGAVVVALGSRDPSIEDLEAEARRLAIVAGRPVHVIALDD